MTLRLLECVREDVAEIADRLDRESDGLGSEFESDVRKAIDAIELTPRLFSPTTDGPENYETREFFIRRFACRVIYAVQESEIVVVAAVHARRRPGVWRKRLTTGE